MSDLPPGSSSNPASEPPPATRHNWLLHLGLFLATVVSVFIAGAMWAVPYRGDGGELALLLHGLKHLPQGWTFAVPLLAILVTHEFGHFFAAMLHRVPASLPYFIPLPLYSPFGTMGAVISMPARIRSRNALLDIGAAGPLAGFVVALPVLVIGLMQSPVLPVSGSGIQEGNCLLYLLLKRLAVGPIPAGYDVFLTPTALAGWTGLLITMLNLIPVGQLDGGHIAYALFERRQLKFGRLVHHSLLVAAAYNVLMYQAVAPGMIWLVWWVLLGIMGRAAGDEAHPPTEPGQLSPTRRWVAIFCLLLFVVLFMPTPMRIY